MTTARRRNVGVLIGVAVVAALIVISRRVNWIEVSQEMRSASPALLASAIVVNLVSLWVRSMQWWVLLRRVGVKSRWLVTRATAIGAALNTLLIAQGGEGGKVLLVARESRVHSSRVVASLGLDRVVDLVSYTILLTVAAYALDLPPQLSNALRWVVAVALVAVSTIYLLARPSSHVPLSMGADAIVESVGSRIREYVRSLRNAAREIATVPALSLATAFSLGAWLLQAATYHLVALATHTPIPLAASITALLACTVGFVLRATPGSVGIFQIGYALSVRSFGITEESAVAIAILIQVIQVFPVIAVAALFAPGFSGSPEKLQGTLP